LMAGPCVAGVFLAAGRQWRHLHRGGRQGAGSNPQAPALPKEDDLGELPWQVGLASAIACFARGAVVCWEG
jgi:hypothetical protein